MSGLDELRRYSAEQEVERRRRELNDSIRRANIPRKHLTDVKPIPESLEYRGKVARWTKRYLESLNAGEHWPGLYLFGPPGSGKTHLAANLAHWAITCRVPTYFLGYTDLFEERKNPAPYDDNLLPHLDTWTVTMTTQLLVVDDVSRMADTSYERLNLKVFGDLMGHRLNEGLTTIVTSNLTLDEMGSVRGMERTAELLMESCYAVEVTGMNVRQIIARKMEDL